MTAPALTRHYEQLALDRQVKTGLALARSLALGPGLRVLEIGCGTGLLAEHLADLVGPTGEVLGLDNLPLRVQIAHQRGRHNLRFQVGDPSQLARFRPASFDRILANGVLHTWPDQTGALAECARLLTAEGRLGLATHSAAHPHPAERVRDALLAEAPYAAHPWPAEARHHPVDAEQLHALLHAAGFGAVQIHAQPELVLHAQADGAIESMQATAWGRFLTHLPEPLRAAARSEIARRLEAGRGPDGIRHETLRLSAVAARPSPAAPARAPPVP